jgi:hypothetical protein
MASSSRVEEMLGVTMMEFTKRLGPAEIGRSAAVKVEENVRVLSRGNAGFRQVDDIGGEAPTESLNSLLGSVSATSTREVDNLIGRLQTLRKRLEADNDRIQREIATYTSLSEQVMQLTKIISESVQKLPEAPHSGR